MFESERAWRHISLTLRALERTAVRNAWSQSIHASTAFYRHSLHDGGVSSQVQLDFLEGECLTQRWQPLDVVRHGRASEHEVSDTPLRRNNLSALNPSTGPTSIFSYPPLSRVRRDRGLSRDSFRNSGLEAAGHRFRLWMRLDNAQRPLPRNGIGERNASLVALMKTLTSHGELIMRVHRGELAAHLSYGKQMQFHDVYCSTGRTQASSTSLPRVGEVNAFTILRYCTCTRPSLIQVLRPNLTVLQSRSGPFTTDHCVFTTSLCIQPLDTATMHFGSVYSMMEKPCDPCRLHPASPSQHHASHLDHRPIRNTSGTAGFFTPSWIIMELYGQRNSDT